MEQSEYEQGESAHEDQLFPVHIAYSTYDAVAICTVTEGGTQTGDLVEVTISDDYRPFLAGQRAGTEALPSYRDKVLDKLMETLTALWMQYWSGIKFADYHAESESHVLTAYLIGHPRNLHLAITRERRTMAHADVVYHSGAFRIVESTCQGLRFSFETRPRDPALAIAFDLLAPGVADS